MVVPLAARWVAAACGVILVLTGWQSVIGTLIVPRPVGSWLTRLVDRLVLAFYMSVTRPVTDWVRRDRILATQSAAILVGQLVAWLAIFLAGFTLMLWPSRGRSITSALTDAGSSVLLRLPATHRSPRARGGVAGLPPSLSSPPPGRGGPAPFRWSSSSPR